MVRIAADSHEKPALAGGFKFPAPPLGAIYSTNITPDRETGIGRYSDGQIARMLRYAVRPNGRASIRPLMPYGDMSDDDEVAILSFLRSQPPVRNVVPDAEWTLVGKVIKSLAPTFKPRTDADIRPAKASPPSKATRERGEYLARAVGNCSGCHSPLDQLTFAVNGPEFSGGVAIEPRNLPNADHAPWFAPPNLTPLAGSALKRFPDRDTFRGSFPEGRAQVSGVANAVGLLQPHDGRRRGRALRVLQLAVACGAAVAAGTDRQTRVADWERSS